MKITDAKSSYFLNGIPYLKAGDEEEKEKEKKRQALLRRQRKQEDGAVASILGSIASRGDRHRSERDQHQLRDQSRQL